jgi:hypothetical protein
VSKNKSSLAAFLAPKFEGIDLNMAVDGTKLNKSYLESLIDGSYATNGVWLRGEHAIALANYLGVSARQILAAQIEDELAFAERVFKVKEDNHEAPSTAATEAPAAAPAVDPVGTVTEVKPKKTERRAGGSKSPMIAKPGSQQERFSSKDM